VSVREQTGVCSGALEVSAQEQTKHTNNKPMNRNTVRKRTDHEPGSLSASDEDHFETFWRVFPKRGPHTNPKHPAKEEYRAALKRGADPQVIKRGAANYATAMTRAGTPSRYIKQARYWLKDRLWEQYASDEIEPDLPLVAGMI
jgi:hypothetical protein